MPLPAPQPVREYEGVDRHLFEDEIRAIGRPAVLRGLASEWPAVGAARTSDVDFIDYIRRFRLKHSVSVLVGQPEIEGRFFYDETLTGLNFGSGTSPIDPFLDRLLRDATNPRPFAIAIQSMPIPEVMPGFERENATDLLDPTVVPRMWMGNRVRVAPHYDLMENIGVVVAGRRRFLLFPPDQIGNLYVGPFEITPAGTPISLVDTWNPDLDRFPRYAEAMKFAQVAELDPGDAIYIPFHWWHGVDSLAPLNLFVNYWWNPARADLGNPYDALMHAFLSLKNLPPDQRQAWRTVFDYYIFRPDSDPGAHLPEGARGVLGEPSPQQIGRMRATLREILKSL
jgi:hypothetical protein